jgi:hypothetical protein
MKKIILIAVALMLSLGAYSQTTRSAVDSAKTNKREPVKSRDTSVDLKKASTRQPLDPGVKVSEYVDSKGYTYDLMKTKKGRYFYIKNSAKTQKPYRVYVEIKD